MKLIDLNCDVIDRPTENKFIIKLIKIKAEIKFKLIICFKVAAAMSSIHDIYILRYFHP